MTHAFVRLTKVGLLFLLSLPPLVVVCSQLGASAPSSGSFWVRVALLAIATVGAGILVGRWLERKQAVLVELSTAQSRFLDEWPISRVPLAVFGSAALSLFLELATIRWQGTEWEVFAFYKNFGLLACFGGLGLGYALARRDQIPSAFVLPLFGVQMLVLVALRHALPPESLLSLRVTPVREQLNMGLDTATSIPEYVAVYAFLGCVVMVTALAFVPVGQVCGRLLGRLPHLRAYGLNLLGSIAGVLLMFAVSSLWTPPIIWFALCCALWLWFQAREPAVFLSGLAASALVILVLGWPVSFEWERIYSPYQLLEHGPGERGLMVIRAAGHYFQRVHDLSPSAQAAAPETRATAKYYELSYRLHPQPRRVAVVGAGSGNDVAAALRSGVEHVDAIEIDPAIAMLGASYHPERPYSDRRVTRIVDDARTFLRSTNQTYDLIVYGLLDSHTLLSHTSSVRLDSFVYTVEGLRDARARLNPGGIVCLSFVVLSEELGRKIYLMMEQAFGAPPVALRGVYDHGTVFVQSKEGNLKPEDSLMKTIGLEDLTARYANLAVKADVSTDDWPFFYMPRRVYPLSYVWALGVVLGVSAFLFFGLVREKPQVQQAPFFFLGAGFMLVETKGITELGLTFGNTWQVIGIVIAAILAMGYLANMLVDRLRIQQPWTAYVLLLASLGVGLVMVRYQGFASTPGGQVAAVVVLTCPMFFSGIVFSTLLAAAGEVPGALAMNLFGAMVGGVLEYNSMYFGFRFLYWIAMGLYGAALVASLSRSVSRVASGAPVAEQV